MDAPNRRPRGLAWLLMLLTATLLLAPPARAVTPREAADRLVNGVFRGTEGLGADQFNELQQVVADARSRGLQLTVAVLGDEATSATDFASELAAIEGGTVLVFTDTAYGIFSTELSPSDLDGAIRAAAPALSGGDVVRGAESFVEAAVPTPHAWGWIAGAALLALGSAGIVARTIESRRARRRAGAALAHRMSELRARAARAAGTMTRLSARVGESRDDTVRVMYRQAADLSTDLETGLDEPVAAEEVDRFGEQLDRLEATLGRLERTLDRGEPGSSR